MAEDPHKGEVNSEAVSRRTWQEFRDAGLLWWVNRGLHLFGWAIVVAVETDGSISDVYPARVTFRGFTDDAEARGFKRLTSHMRDQVGSLLQEVEGE